MVKTLTASAMLPYIDSLAALRIQVFREWPYLYDGSLAYEYQYLQTYLTSSHSMLAVALDGGRMVGAATALPLADETPDCQKPFIETGLAPNKVFYFGESVLLPSYRGQGLGHEFFEHRERFARSVIGIQYTAFCAVKRATNDPRRPDNARDLSAFWQNRGYQLQPQMIAEFEWKEINENVASKKAMQFWLRAL